MLFFRHCTTLQPLCVAVQLAEGEEGPDCASDCASRISHLASERRPRTPRLVPGTDPVAACVRALCSGVCCLVCAPPHTASTAAHTHHSPADSTSVTERGQIHQDPHPFTQPTMRHAVPGTAFLRDCARPRKPRCRIISAASTQPLYTSRPAGACRRPDEINQHNDARVVVRLRSCLPKEHMFKAEARPRGR